MTAADNRCECCGHDDLPLGVASSSIGAISIFWCGVCPPMSAEPKWALETVADTLPSDQILEGFTYYEPKDDTYRNARTGDAVPIEFSDGFSCRTRTQAVQHFADLKQKAGTSTPPPA
jgi:hypothetical protein